MNDEWRKLALDDFCWGDSTYTSVFAVTGEGTCFDGKTANSWNDVPGDTLILVKSNVPRLHWMQPGDVSVEELDQDVPASEMLGINDDDFLVAFADGTIWRILSTVPVILIADQPDWRVKETANSLLNIKCQQGNRSTCKID